MKKQSGFSAVIVLLLIAVIGLSGAVGWLVMNRQQPEAVVDDGTVSKLDESTSSDENESETNNPEFYKISKWGVKVPINNTTSTLYLADGGFRSGELDQMFPQCTANTILVDRGTANQHMKTEVSDDGPTYAETYADYANQHEATLIRVKIGEYYYLTPHYRGASCAQNQADGQKESSIINEIYSAVNKMVAL